MLHSKDIAYQSGLKHRIRDAWVAQGVEHLPLTQAVILESGSESHIGLLVGSLLLLLPNFLSLSLSLSLINKIVIKKTRSILTLPTRCSL